MKSLFIIIVAFLSFGFRHNQYTTSIDWYEIIEIVSEKVSCITWPHKDISPPYLSIESNSAYLVVGDDWRPTYYLKDADCTISTSRVWWSWNLNNWFWKHDNWLGISSKKFKCDYINYGGWSCTPITNK